MKTQRIIAFYRVSTEEQAAKDRAGIPRQREAVSRAAKARDFEIVEEIELSGVSGSNVRNSPVFREMLRKVRDREVDGVAVSDMDRLVRLDNLADLEILDVFRMVGASIHTAECVSDFATNEGIFTSHIKAVFGGYERRLIIQRAQNGKEVKRRQGKCPSASITLPLCVTYDRKANLWSYTPEVKKVKEAFRAIDEDGETNLTVIGKQVGIQPRTLWNLLRNPIYAGWRVYDKKRGEEKYHSTDGKQADRRKVFRTPENTIRVQVFPVPAVHPDRFERVQAILNEKGTKWRRQRESIEINLGTGIAVCSHCGKKLYASSGRRSSGNRPGYYCCAANYYLAKRKGSSCPQANVRKDHLDKTLVAFVSKYLTSEEVLVCLAKTISAPAQDSSKAANAQIAELRKKKTRILPLYEDGIIEKDELDTRIKEINAEIQAATNSLNVTAERNRIRQESSLNLRLLAKAAVAFKSITTKAEQQAALRGLLASVAFDGQKIVGFVPLLQGLDHAGYTENGIRTHTDSSPRPT